MNAERLHIILIEIKEEIIGLVNKMQILRKHLQNVVTQPQQAEHQQNLVKSLKEITNELANASSNEFSPGWKQIIEEIGGTEIIGINLQNRLESVFARNQITPSTALEKINEISTSLTNFNTAINETISGFQKLNIGSEELDEGECELGYTIPRVYVKNKLSSLSKEISELNFILSNFSEVVEGEKKEFKVKTISSSDYLLYISIGLVIAEVFSRSVERIINIYKNILEIKKLKNELKERGVSDKDTKSIGNHANSMMEKEIKKIVQETMKKYYKVQDTGRKNELENGLTISLNKIANRIDQGFNIEIRIEPLPEPDEDEKVTREDKVKLNLVNSIQKSSKTLEFIKTSGQPILRLEESDKMKKKEEEK